MSSGADNGRGATTAAPRRRHDAAASRGALLEAAIALFDARGYDGATVREIGERAGVDPALIARYFGSKEGLYLATLEGRQHGCLEGCPRHVLTEILGRSEEHGTGPVLRAMASATLSDCARDQVRDVIAHRVVDPLAARMEDAGRPPSDARLRAELLVAVTVGIAMTRAGGTLPALADTQLADVVATLEPAIEALAGGEER